MSDHPMTVMPRVDCPLCGRSISLQGGRLRVHRVPGNWRAPLCAASGRHPERVEENQ